MYNKVLLLSILLCILSTGCEFSPTSQIQKNTDLEYPNIHSSQQTIDKKILLSNYLDFTESLYIGYQAGDTIIYKNYSDNVIRSLNLTTNDSTPLIELNTTTNGNMTTFDYNNNWFVWSECQDPELRVGQTTGKGWAIYAANILTNQIIQVDSENKYFPQDRNYDPHPWFISVQDNFVAFSGYHADQTGVYAAIKLYDLATQKLVNIETSDMSKVQYGDPTINQYGISYLKYNIESDSAYRATLCFYDFKIQNTHTIECPEDFQTAQLTQNYIVCATAFSPNHPAALYCYNLKQKQWTAKIDSTVHLYPTSNLSNLEFSELQACNDFVLWRPLTGNEIYVWDLSQNHIFEIDNSIHKNINYILYPFDNMAFVWCESDSQNKKINYQFVALKF